jgi:hypothetical protein
MLLSRLEFITAVFPSNFAFECVCEADERGGLSVKLEGAGELLVIKSVACHQRRVKREPRSSKK